jgi:glycosyltransferase involved in cell wall biosynthesis
MWQRTGARMKQSICLAMIVRNEEHVIERCLRSVMPHVDCVVIHDTGSTDGTLGLIYRVLNDWPTISKVIKRTIWVDFATNRNSVLADAYDNGAGYVFTIDADEELITTDLIRPVLTKDLYNIPVEYAGTHYTRAALFVNDGTFQYRGPVHEYLRRGLHGEDMPIEQVTSTWEWTIKVYHEGSRSKDPNTYANDSIVLKKHLAKVDPSTYDYARTLYYLAQSYKDAGMFEAAFAAYKERANLTGVGWDQERWHAQMSMAHMMKVLEHKPSRILFEYLQAFNLMPRRPEPLYYAAKMLDGGWPLKEMLLSRAWDLCHFVQPGLFNEPLVYKYYIPLDLSVALWYLGQKAPSLELMEHLKMQKDAPSNVKQALESNLKFYE